MASCYSMDLRSRVVADVDAGFKPVEVAQKYRVSRSWVYKNHPFSSRHGELCGAPATPRPLSQAGWSLAATGASGARAARCHAA